ncbi:hypothetical protein [Spiroplasma endosymbiont of Clivina fossor]
MKVIFYIDMNAFFASCHQVIDPSIASEPIVVSTQSTIQKSNCRFS